MKFDIKTPAKVDHWRASDGKTFDCEERARTHEVFLAVNPCLSSTADSRYSVVTELARKFDFVPRQLSSRGMLGMPSVTSPAPTASDARPRCEECGMPQNHTPSGLTCVNGHGGAGSL